MTDSRWIALRAWETRGDLPVLARDPDDRVHEPGDLLAARLERGAHAVDEERPVVGVGLQHRAERLVALVAEGRVERAHRDRRAAALVGEPYAPSTSAARCSGEMPSVDSRRT